MSSNDVSLWLHVMGMEDAVLEADEVERKSDEVVLRWARVKSETLRDMRTVEMGMHMSVSLVRNILGAVGQSLGPLESAMLGTIEVTVESLIRIAAAWGTTGYGLAFTVAIGTAAIALSAWSTAAVMNGMTAARQQIDHAVAATENLYSMFRMFGRP